MPSTALKIRSDRVNPLEAGGTGAGGSESLLPWRLIKNYNPAVNEFKLRIECKNDYDDECHY
jgi:hypothetical protein